MLIFVLWIVVLVLRIVSHEHNREHKKEHKNRHSGAQENHRIWAYFIVLIFVLRIVPTVSVTRNDTTYIYICTYIYIYACVNIGLLDE